MSRAKDLLYLAVLSYNKGHYEEAGALFSGAMHADGINDIMQELNPRHLETTLDSSSFASLSEDDEFVKGITQHKKELKPSVTLEKREPKDVKEPDTYYMEDGDTSTEFRNPNLPGYSVLPGTVEPPEVNLIPVGSSPVVVKQATKHE